MNTRLYLFFGLLLLLLCRTASAQNTAFIQGRLWADNLSNCQFDFPADRYLSGIVLSVTNTNTGEERYTSSDGQGFYVFDSLIAGTYTIRPHLPYEGIYYTFSCVAPSVTQLVTSTAQIDFPISTFFQQGLTRLDLSSSLMRPCQPAQISIAVSNIGTDTLHNILLDLQLDPHLSYTGFSSDAANTSALTLGNNRYRFVLPNLPPADSLFERFFIWAAVELSCDATTSQAILCKANIANADTLSIIPNFNDAVLELEADSCISGDTIEWKVRNLRPIPTTQPYIVIEDNIMLRQGSVVVAGNGSGSMYQHAPDSMRSYRMEIKQVDGIPAILGDSIVWALSPACAGSGKIGIEATQFYTETTTPNKGFDCVPVRAAWAGNFLAASPTGYDSAHYINRGFPVEYQVHFQNTSAATANSASLSLDIDTSFYELPSLRMGAASDAYTWSLRSLPNAQFARLQINMNARNAWLPATQDSAQSRGFAAFSLLPRRSLPAETSINLQAQISLNVQSAIQTDIASHTIAGTRNSFIQVLSVSWAQAESKAQLHIYPNPMREQARIRVDFANNNEDLSNAVLRIYNPLGQLVGQVQSQANGEFIVQRQNWAAGLYSFELCGKGGERWAVGRLVVE